VQHIGHQLMSTMSWEHRELRNPLNHIGFPPRLRIATSLAVDVETLCHRFQQAVAPAVQNTLILWQQTVLHSSLNDADTAGLHSLAVSCFFSCGENSMGRAPISR
jgi:hypothetical protein